MNLISSLEKSSLVPKPARISNSHTGYVFIWRQGKLFVRQSPVDKQQFLPCTENQSALINCLRLSSVALVCLDPDVGEAHIKQWAEACRQARKSVFLQIKSAPNLPHQRRIRWTIKRGLDLLGALCLLVLLSPLMVMIAIAILIFSPGPVFYQQWRVGEQGRLFRMIKFRTMHVNAEKLHRQVMVAQTGLHKLKDDPRITSLGRHLRRYSLDELPQLFNVLRGEMSLVGPRPWALGDALRIRPELQHRLKALPGITGIWQVKERSNLLDLDAVNQMDLEYLETWSLWQDLYILLLTIPKVISGLGAF